MTEQEWLDCRKAEDMVRFLHFPRPSPPADSGVVPAAWYAVPEAKARRLASFCVRRGVWGLSSNTAGPYGPRTDRAWAQERHAHALVYAGLGDRLADHLEDYGGKEEGRRHEDALRQEIKFREERLFGPGNSRGFVWRPGESTRSWLEAELEWAAAGEVGARALREMLGNPFRPILDPRPGQITPLPGSLRKESLGLDLRWSGHPEIIGLAKEVHAGAWRLKDVLADACDDLSRGAGLFSRAAQAVIDHLRSPGDVYRLPTPCCHCGWDYLPRGSTPPLAVCKGCGRGCGFAASMFETCHLKGCWAVDLLRGPC